MKLAVWRRENGKTQEWIASAIGCSQSYVSQIERSVSPLVPRKDIAVAIFTITDGAVSPNDFYDLDAVSLGAAGEPVELQDAA